MSKIVILGDLHLGVRNGSSLFLKEQEKFFTYLFDYILKNNIQEVFCLGDVLDKRKQVDFLVSKFLQEKFFKFFDTHKIMFRSVIGNHDLYYKNTMDINGVSQLNKSIYVRFYEKIESCYFDSCKFTFCPWICEENKQEIEEFFKNYEKTDFDILLGHFELAGFTIMKGYLSEKGSIDKKLLSCFDKVFSGHYHTPSDNQNITYVGTPYQLTWSDVDDEKRFFVLDTETREIEEILTHPKLFQKYNYFDELTLDYSQVESCFVKIILTKEFDQGKFEDFLVELEEKGKPFQVQVIDNRNANSGIDEEVIDLDVDNPIEAMLKELEKTITDEIVLKYAQDFTLSIFKLAQEKKNA